MDTFTIYSDGQAVCTVRAVEAEIYNGHLYLRGTDECSDILVAVFMGKALGAVRQEDIPGSTMSVREFRKKGYLQELNRQFLHPLGLAMGVRVEQGGTEALTGLWDYRRDPEGIRYDTIDEKKAAYVIEQQEKRAAARQEALGYVVQPVKWPISSKSRGKDEPRRESPKRMAIRCRHRADREQSRQGTTPSQRKAKRLLGGMAGDRPMLRLRHQGR